MNPSMEVLGVPIRDALAFKLGAVGFFALFAGMLALAVVKHFVDEGRLREDPELKEIYIEGRAPNRILSPFGLKLRIAGYILSATGVALLAGAYLIEKT